MAQASANAEVAGVIDGGLGAQGTALFIVLLDTGAFVVEMKRRIDICSEYPGAKATRGAAGDAPAEDELYELGRPRSMWSLIASSKNLRPESGQSKT